jgi:hypothetical protein
LADFESRVESNEKLRVTLDVQTLAHKPYVRYRTKNMDGFQAKNTKVGATNHSRVERAGTSQTALKNPVY